MTLYLYVIVGLLLGYLYFDNFERFDPKSLPEKCWSVLHYLNKQNSPLYLVHLKSITAGALLVIASVYGWNKIIAVVGSCIIGLHVAQFFSEKRLINGAQSK
jgi:hypothetical protein